MSVLPFDEINALMKRSYSETEDAEILSDILLGILVDAYRHGVSKTCKSLGVEVEDEIDEMYEIIFCRIDGLNFEDRLLIHIEAGDEGRIGTLAESEAHRVSETAAFKTAEKAGRDYGIQVGKKWETMLDDRVRDTHMYLEGRVVSLGEEFYTYDGDHALYPGGFQSASENANCRCTLSYVNLNTSGVAPDIGQGSP